MVIPTPPRNKKMPELKTKAIAMRMKRGDLTDTIYCSIGVE